MKIREPYSTEFTEISESVLSGATVVDLPVNPPRNRDLNNPGTWAQEERERVHHQLGSEVPVINHQATLAALEHAIQALDMVRIGRKIEPDELATTLRELRACRVEHLKEIG